MLQTFLISKILGTFSEYEIILKKLVRKGRKIDKKLKNDRRSLIIRRHGITRCQFNSRFLLEVISNIF